MLRLKIFTWIVMVLFYIHPLGAQLTRTEFGIGAGTFQILDDSKYIWNNSMLFQAYMLHGKNSSRKIMTWHGFTAFYAKQTPGPDTIFVDTTPLNYEYYIFGARTTIGLGGSFKWITTPKGPLSFFWRTDFGIFSEDYVVEHKEPGVISEGGDGSLGAFITPCTGLQYAKNNGFGAYIHGAYQFAYSAANEINQSLSFGGGVLFRL